MMADDNKFAADAAERGDPTENVSDETILALPDSRDEVPVADMLEQAIAVREVQIFRPKGSRKKPLRPIGPSSPSKYPSTRKWIVDTWLPDVEGWPRIAKQTQSRRLLPTERYPQNRLSCVTNRPSRLVALDHANGYPGRIDQGLT